MDAARYRELSANVIRLMGRGEYCTDVTQGHFALATLNYTHSTAPNRRYPDLVNQRMLFAVLAGRPLPYTLEVVKAQQRFLCLLTGVQELDRIAKQCTEMEDASNKLERKVTKVKFCWTNALGR
jgi:exoribonuclease R